MISEGMDAGRVRQVAGALRAQSSALGDVGGKGTALMRVLDGAWEGSDTEQFSRAWDGLRPAIERASQMLSQMAEGLAVQAEDQEGASEGEGGPRLPRLPFPIPLPPLPPLPRWPKLPRLPLPPWPFPVPPIPPFPRIPRLPLPPWPFPPIPRCPVPVPPLPEPRIPRVPDGGGDDGPKLPPPVPPIMATSPFASTMVADPLPTPPSIPEDFPKGPYNPVPTPIPVDPMPYPLDPDPFSPGGPFAHPLDRPFPERPFPEN